MKGHALRRALTQGQYVIGRDDDCAICIDDNEASRQHARLVVTPTAWRVDDLGSSNGTFINDARVANTAVVHPGQTIRIGHTRIELNRSVDEDDNGLTPLPWEAAQTELLRQHHLLGPKYHVGRVLSRDNTSTLFEARDLSLHRTVAMKVMVLNRQPSAEDLLRFIQEAQILSQLEHPAIPSLLEIGANEECRAFFTTPYLEGELLETVLQRLADNDIVTQHTFPLPRLLDIFRHVADGVAHAHRRGVIHRDLKPEHIIIAATNGHVAILDWGIAKVLPSDGSLQTPASPKPGGAAAALQTMTGMIMGTPDFMSPEQAEGRSDAADERTDVYALGGILYHILTLQPPITGNTLAEKLEKARQGQIAPPATVRSDIPPKLSAIAMKALSYRPEDRYPDVPSMLQALDASRQPQACWFSRLLRR